MGTLAKIAICATGLLLGSVAMGQPFPSYSDFHPVDPTWTGPKFKLSQDYPTAVPATTSYPWQSIDFKTAWKPYLKAVLDYSLEGNTALDWYDVGANPVRPWFHAPALHVDECKGREFIHGLTRERVSRPYELHEKQGSFAENWAVGLYNEPGGWVMGRVWGTSGAPDPSKADFPEGAVSIKLLFTAAKITEVPYLENSLEWDAHIYTQANNPCPGSGPVAPRSLAKMHLLQIDLGVRDSRSPTGWVFGTYVYSAAQPGSTVYDRLVPVGIMWGNDPTVATDMNKAGSFINADLKESILNPDLLAQPPGHDYGKNAYMVHHGLGGRLNGPVDNPISACLSCHGRARHPEQAVVPNATVGNYTAAQFNTYFKNVPAGTAGGALDYSLQLAEGLDECPDGNCRLAYDWEMLAAILKKHQAIETDWPWPWPPPAAPVAPLAAGAVETLGHARPRSHGLRETADPRPDWNQQSQPVAPD